MSRPATAGEALRGLAEARESHPAPLQPSAVADRLHALLDRHFAPDPAARGPVRVHFSGSATTVATVGQPPAAVLKVHADRQRYEAEALAYALTAPTLAVPQLVRADDDSRSLLTEYLPHPFGWHRSYAPADLIAVVAAVHCAPAKYDPATAEATAPFRLDRLTGRPVPAWIADRSAWADVLALCQTAHGPGHVPLGHLDLKPDHLRRRNDGTPAVLDIETLRPDITGLVDLVTLPAVLRQASRPVRAPELLELYQEATGRHGVRWSLELLRAALIAYQRATGLATLDGLAD